MEQLIEWGGQRRMRKEVINHISSLGDFLSLSSKLIFEVGESCGDLVKIVLEVLVFLIGIAKDIRKLAINASSDVLDCSFVGLDLIWDGIQKFEALLGKCPALVERFFPLIDVVFESWEFSIGFLELVSRTVGNLQNFIDFFINGI